ncbi:MAG: 7-carboxy-7-deazaguanine synthase QueE [Bacteroidota bacterium]
MKTVKQKEVAKSLHYQQANPLPVMEHFLTLQGEGSWTGTAAYFIRLAGCDVGCHWCDVKDSWHPSQDQYLSVSEITELALASGTERVVITGGEPTVYDLSLLTQSLHQAGLIIHMETAGVHPLTAEIDWICFSPKKFLPPKDEFYQLSHELKIVVYHEKDVIWAEQHAARCADHIVKYLQPEWSRATRITPHLVDYVKHHPTWRLSLQTHKFIDIP